VLVCDVLEEEEEEEEEEDQARDVPWPVLFKKLNFLYD
jgi:hypothetical protein